MNKLLSLVKLGSGVVMIVVGINVTESFSSHVSPISTDSPTDTSVLMIISGSLLSVIGVTAIVRTTKKT